MTSLKKLTLFGTMHFITKGSFILYGMGGGTSRGMRKIWTNPDGGGRKILDASQRARGAKNFRLDLNFFKVYVNNSW